MTGPRWLRTDGASGGELLQVAQILRLRVEYVTDERAGLVWGVTALIPGCVVDVIRGLPDEEHARRALTILTAALCDPDNTSDGPIDAETVRMIALHGPGVAVAVAVAGREVAPTREDGGSERGSSPPVATDDGLSSASESRTAPDRPQHTTAHPSHDLDANGVCVECGLCSDDYCCPGIRKSCRGLWYESPNTGSAVDAAVTSPDSYDGDAGAEGRVASDGAVTRPERGVEPDGAAGSRPARTSSGPHVSGRESESVAGPEHEATASTADTGQPAQAPDLPAVTTDAHGRKWVVLACGHEARALPYGSARNQRWCYQCGGLRLVDQTAVPS